MVSSVDPQDWLLMQVEQLAEAARRVASAVLGREHEQLVEVDGQTDGLLEDLFDHTQLLMLDSRSTALILRPPERIRGYAQLLTEKAALALALDRPVEAQRWIQRGLELYLEAAVFDPDDTHIDFGAIGKLLAWQPAPFLSPRYQQLLDDTAGRDCR